MRVVFFGATELGYRCCKLMLEERLAEVAAIFTIPQQFSISYSQQPVSNVLYADMAQLGARFGVPVIEIEGKMTAYVDQIASYSPDFLLAIGWYYMIPRTIRAIASKGCAGIHASLLPKYRGGAPLVWAMINGEQEAGVTFFHFDDGVDDGDIIAQRAFPILCQDTIRDVLVKAEDASLKVLREYIPRIAAGDAPRIAQDHTQATHVPQRKPEDGGVDWRWDTERIRNFIRAQTHPYPGAFTIIGDKKVYLWDADVIQLDEAAMES